MGIINDNMVLILFKELCTRIIPDLDNCTNQDKKDAYTYTDLKLRVTPEGVDIKC